MNKVQLESHYPLSNESHSQDCQNCDKTVTNDQLK